MPHGNESIDSFPSKWNSKKVFVFIIENDIKFDDNSSRINMRKKSQTFSKFRTFDLFKDCFVELKNTKKKQTFK